MGVAVRSPSGSSQAVRRAHMRGAHARSLLATTSSLPCKNPGGETDGCAWQEPQVSGTAAQEISEAAKEESNELSEAAAESAAAEMRFERAADTLEQRVASDPELVAPF